MVGVSRFTENLLKAVEDELTVRIPSPVLKPNQTLRFVVLGRKLTFQEWDLNSLHRRTLPPKLSFPCELSISLPRPSRSPTRQGPQPASCLFCLGRPRRR